MKLEQWQFKYPCPNSRVRVNIGSLLWKREGRLSRPALEGASLKWGSLLFTAVTPSVFKRSLRRMRPPPKLGHGYYSCHCFLTPCFTHPATKTLETCKRRHETQLTGYKKLFPFSLWHRITNQKAAANHRRVPTPKSTWDNRLLVEISSLLRLYLSVWSVEPRSRSSCHTRLLVPPTLPPRRVCGLDGGNQSPVRLMTLNEGQISRKGQQLPGFSKSNRINVLGWLSSRWFDILAIKQKGI